MMSEDKSNGAGAPQKEVAAGAPAVSARPVPDESVEANVTNTNHQPGSAAPPVEQSSKADLAEQEASSPRTEQLEKTAAKLDSELGEHVERSRSWVRLVLGALTYVALLALYAGEFMGALGNIVQLPQMAAQLGTSITGVGWAWLGGQLVLAPLMLLAAVLLGLRRRLSSRLLLLLTGVAVVAAVQLEILLLVPTVSFFA